ncbi:MAG: Rieske (2Fe-2S) protein [Amylibacter sp.]|nr:Rieske (2Fe-2S) protein [Amylibacter sp.]
MTRLWGIVLNWIAVGLAEDIPVGTVVPRRVDGLDLAIWRSRLGRFHAWDDRCPHRGMRLSHGFVRGEVLACVYHGWQYNLDGACDYIPAHPDLTPPKTICANTYVCETRNQALWVALGTINGDVPDIGDRIPIRSLDISCGAPAIARYFNHPQDPLIVLKGKYDLAIALQPSTSRSCFAHVFAGAGQDKKIVSRYVEKLRDELEAA